MTEANTTNDEVQVPDNTLESPYPIGLLLNAEIPEGYVKSETELLLEQIIKDRYGINTKYSWYSHLAAFDHTIYSLRHLIEEHKTILDERYDALRERIQLYETMMQDITMDDGMFTMDNTQAEFTGYSILSRAAEWDNELRKLILALEAKVSAEYLMVKEEILNQLPKASDYVSAVIQEIGEAPIIKNLESAIQSNGTFVSDLAADHNALKLKQYQDYLESQRLLGEAEDRITFNFNTLLDQQVNALAVETTSRIAGLLQAEDGLTEEVIARTEADAELNQKILALKSTTEDNFSIINQELTTATDGYGSLASKLEAIASGTDDTMASILSTYVTKVDNNSALAAINTEISTTNTNLSLTNQVVDGVKAVNVISVNNNGVIAGYGLISELVDGQVTSAFGVNADYFYVGSPSGTGKKMFVVRNTPGSEGGVDYPAGTWIDVGFIANASIGTAKIADAAIDTAKIKDAAITEAKIENLAVTTAKIKDAAISTAKIGDAQITTAKIDNLAVTSGKIDNLAVTTFKIGNNAVTVPVVGSWYNEIGSSSAWVNIGSINVNMGAGGLLLASASIKQHFPGGLRHWEFKLLINNTVVFESYGDDSIDSVSLTGALAVGPGTHTVTLSWYGDVGMQMKNRTLWAMGAMR